MLRIKKMKNYMAKLSKLLYILFSLRKRENRTIFFVKIFEYLNDIARQDKRILSTFDKGIPVSKSFSIDMLCLNGDHKVLLVIHQFSRTGAPRAVLYLARALFMIHGMHPVIISPEDGQIREEFEKEGFPTIVDPLLFSYKNYEPDVCDFVGSFEMVIVTSLASFAFISCFRGIAKNLVWWIHETEAGFNSVASMTTDLRMLFTVCESIWLGSMLCFPLALKYVHEDKLHLLFYGCIDTAVPSKPNMSGKIVFSVIGSVESRKGQDIFLEAIEMLPITIRRKAVFRIIGSPLPFEASEVFYKRICARAKSISEVVFIPNVPFDELQKFYSETDVIVSTSRDDPMPIVVTQGLMFSKLCLCSSAIGHANLIDSGKDGLIFSSESARELSEKMIWILQNQNEIKSLGIAGRAIYDNYFDMPSFVDNVSKLI